MARLARLRAFLTEGARLPFVWGARDCSLWPCDWIAAERGRDPAAALRGAYATRLGCARLLARAGGLPVLARCLAAEAGLVATSSPAPGDVGLVATRIGPVLMLCAGSRWAWKSREGVLFAPVRPEQAWSV